MALPSEVGQIAEVYYREAGLLATMTAQEVQSLWNAIPFDVSIIEGWNTISGDVTDIVTQDQIDSALLAAAHLAAQADVQGATLDSLPNAPEFTTDSDTAAYWLSYAVGRTLTASNNIGLPEVQARAVGADLLMHTASSLVRDAGREAGQAGITMTTDYAGYYRKLRLPSCSRCAVLAGAYYRWNEGFLRHPNCDCQHVPATDIDDSLAFDSTEAVKSGQVTGLSEADRKAIVEEDADVAQVVNAKRGLRTTDIFGDRVQHTVEGTSRRGRFYVPGRVRLTPREIYRQAGTDRDLARRLLTKHGYVL